MLCCLNPSCEQPINAEHCTYCKQCGQALQALLRHRYKILNPLGKGGFGKTYCAEDIDKLNSLCVVKQFIYQSQNYQANEKALDLFQKEAQQLERLGEHPQIPNLLAYFQEAGYFYLVQQFIEGKTLLEQVRQQGTFGDHQVWNFLMQLLPVLDFIHAKGVIHRDIKPDNIILRQLDGQPILIDFGVAKQVSEAALPQTGTTVGSQGYAPLEQIQAGKVTAKSDLFSLGVTCFQLMSGRSPFHLWSEYGYSWLQHWPAYIDRLIDPTLKHILDLLLQKSSGDRPQSAATLLQEMQTQSQQVSTEMLPELDTTHLPLSGSLPSQQAEQSSAVVPQHSAPSPQFSEQDSAPIPGQIPDQVSKTQLGPGKQTSKKTCIKRLIGVSFGFAACALGLWSWQRLRQTVPSSDPSVGTQSSPDATVSPNVRATPLPTPSQKIPNDSSSVTVAALLEQGLAAYKQGDYADAIALLSEAIKQDPQNAIAYSRRGGAKGASGDLQGAITDLNLAIQLSPDYAGAYYLRGLAHTNNQNPTQGLVDYNQALTLNPKLVSAFIARGNLHLNQTHYSNAIADFTQVIQLWPRNASAYEKRGIAYEGDGRLSDAIADYRQAGKLYLNQGKVEKAKLMRTKVLQLRN